MEQKLRILLLEDVASDAQLIERELHKAKLSFCAKRVESREAFVRELRDFAPDVILSDYCLPQFDGIIAMGLAQEVAPSTPFIIVTGTLDEETAVDCMKSGAADYLLKEHLVRLGAAVEGALEKKRAREEKERAEEKLRQSEGLFRGVVETAGEGIWILDQDSKTTFANKRMADMLGCAVQELMVKPVWDFVYEEDQEFARQIFAQRSHGISSRHDFKFRRRDGSELWTIVAATPLFDKEGRYAGALAMVTDITGRKRAEQELAAKAVELARSNAELEQFAHVAAHDLKEPLRTVASFVQLLASRYKGKLGPDADQYITLVVEGAKRMQEMIQGLLLYSQCSSPRKLGPAPCEAAFERALANLQLAIEESGALVAHDPLPTVVVEPYQLCRLFQNLIGNAVKFHGPVPPQVHVSAAPRDREWLFSVCDNGIGIDPQYSDRIFAIFQRLHLKGEYPGTGIGLAICKKIVEGYGGRIWVESEPGKGSVFYFTLPREDEPSAPEAEAAAGPVQRVRI